MRMLVLTVLLLVGAQGFADEAFVSPCDRHPKVLEAMFNSIGFFEHLGKCREVPPQLFLSTRNLRISGVDPSELKPSDFSGLVHVENLKIVGDPNNKKKFDHTILTQTPKLREIELINIDLSDTPKTFLTNHTRLQRISLINCNLLEVPEFPSTEMNLDLSHNKIKKLPASLKFRPRSDVSMALVKWNFQDNQIVDISTHVDSLYNILELNLSENSIRPLTCDKQSVLVGGSVLIPETRLLSIDAKSINMSSDCDQSGFIRIGRLKLNQANIDDMSHGFKLAMQNRFAIFLTNFSANNNLSSIVGKDLRFLEFINSDLSRLDFGDPVWNDKDFELRIADDSTGSLPNIFNGAQSVRGIRIRMPNLHYIPAGFFKDMPNLKIIEFEDTPLSTTPKTSLNGFIVRGLPKNFGVTPTGGTSEEWAP